MQSAWTLEFNAEYHRQQLLDEAAKDGIAALAARGHRQEVSRLDADLAALARRIGQALGHLAQALHTRAGAGEPHGVGGGMQQGAA